ncbi:MAG: GNAT family N-acetyltransferase [Candidatus Rokubacteria bacterium]|nr:GNAT family N-acetyltransferase [Candidatus Rokubacteria bacterium]
MLTVDLRDDVAGLDWDARLCASTGGSIFQTEGWGRFWQAYLGARPRWLVVRDGRTVVGQLLFHEMLRGHESLLASGGSRLARLAGPLLKVFRWWQGPVIHDPDRRAEIMEAILSRLEALAARRRLCGIEEASLPLPGADETDVLGVFRSAGYRPEWRATILVDLTVGVDALWANLKKDVARTRVRKAQRQGLELARVDSLAALQEFHQLVTEWRREEGFPPYELARYGGMFEHLAPHCSFFLVRLQGEALAGMGVYDFNGRAHLVTPVTSRRARARQIYAGDFLHWEVMRWCHDQGCRVLDLAGVAASPGSTKEEGIRRFKGKWGGRQVRYRVFTRVRTPARWNLVTAARSARRSLRALRLG